MSGETEHRQIVYRLLPGTPCRARRLAAVAGACRFVWNELLDQQDQLYDMARMQGAKPPSVSFFTLGKAFTQLRRVTPWLQEMPFAPVRYSLKYQASAWQAFFRGHARRPRFKRRGNDSVTLPDNVRIEAGRLYFPRIGWMQLRRRGGNPYPRGKPVQAVIRRVGGKWYATVCYRIAALEHEDDGTAVVLDMNAGQVAMVAGEGLGSPGTLLRGPDTTRLEARRRRYQRQLARQRRGSRRRQRTRARLARTQRRLAMRRRNWQHHVSRRIADAAHTVCVEELNTKGMTASARGSAEAPGRNVRQKAGLNRSILDTGWADLCGMLAYKAGRVVPVDAAYTSQTCAACGVVDTLSRLSQAHFKCVACGHADNADVNAARNIRRRGLALLHGEAAGLPGCRACEP